MPDSQQLSNAMIEQPNLVEKIRSLFLHMLAKHDEKQSIETPIFLSFDVAHGNGVKFNDIGISIFDTRFVTGSMTPKLEDHDHALLWTRTYIFRRGSQSVKRTQKRAVFNGSAQKVTGDDRIPLLTHIFHYSDGNNVEPCCGIHKFQPFQSSQCPRSPIEAISTRKIIVIGHSIRQDLSSLRKIGFDVAKVAHVVAFMDTQEIARELYWKKDRSKNISLRDLCKLMGFRPTNLHTSGNDAAYTMIVFLCLASRILGDDPESTDARRTLEELVSNLMVADESAKREKKAARNERGLFEDWAENLDEENF